jgi:hypothetical protein
MASIYTDTPPAINISLTCSCNDVSCSRAFCRELHTSTDDGSSSLVCSCGLEDSMTLMRSFKGRCVLGIDSKLLRPMMTAFFLSLPVFPMVRSLKYFSSRGRCQGMTPFRPIPRVICVWRVCNGREIPLRALLVGESLNYSPNRTIIINSLTNYYA